MRSMSAAKETAPDATRLLKALEMLVRLIGLAAAQVFITFSVGFLAGFALLLPSGYFQGELSHSYPPGKLIWIGAVFLIAGAVFALLWLGVWRLLCGLSGDGRLRYFPLLLLTAYAIFVLLFMQLDPVYNPEAMIPGSAGESTFLVCMGMSGLVLFPLYSAGVYYFVLRPSSQPSTKRMYRYLLLCLVLAAAGLALLPFLWQLAPRIYPGLLTYPA